MRSLTVGALMAGAVVVAGSVWAATVAPTTTHTPVLVELFTSEGCSSCPPADALLSRLQHEQPIAGAQIVVLGEHVDYWDRLGWRDRFSSGQYTARQNSYGARFGLESAYTPQMVVDGTEEFVGNDQNKAWRAVADAAKRIKIPLTLSQPQLDGLRFSATVSASPTVAGESHRGDVYVALVDPLDTTEVKHGENGGRRLNHVSVMRTLARVGSLRDLTDHPLKFHVDAPAGADVAAMQWVVFVQQEGTGPILGVAMGGSAPVSHTQAAVVAGVSSIR